MLVLLEGLMGPDEGAIGVRVRSLEGVDGRCTASPQKWGCDGAHTLAHARARSGSSTSADDSGMAAALQPAVRGVNVPATA
jgi:hypothetical protein